MELDIDTEKVITEVSRRKCLWDFTAHGFKNRAIKYKNWLEIAAEIIAGFDQFKEGKKRIAVERIQQRWRHARDCYNKSRRMQRRHVQTNSKKKLYAFSHNLRFLDTLTDSEVGETTTIKKECTIRKLKNSQPKIELKSETPIKPCSEFKTEVSEVKTKNCTNSEFNNLIEKLINITKNNDDSDVAFFNSIIPMVHELNNYDKLLFRSRVLNELMSFQYNATNLPAISSTHTITPAPSSSPAETSK